MMFEPFDIDPEAPVLVIGAASIDFVARMQRELEHGTSNPAYIQTALGGTARNVAENLARLGQPVKLLSVVGDDNIGTQLLLHTEDAGVNVEHVMRTIEHPTNSYMAVVDQKGGLHYALDDMRAISNLSPAYLRSNRKLFESASVVFVDANLSEESLEGAFELAAESRRPVCADPTSTSLAPKLKPHLEGLYLLAPNINEAGVFCEKPVSGMENERGLEAAKELVSQGVDFAIVTLAEFGVSYATSQTDGHIGAMRTEIADPTGAGDALSAAVIFALLNGVPYDEAVRLGVSAASLTLRHPGAVYRDLSLERLYDELVI